MELNLSKKKLKVTWDGQQFDVVFPTIKLLKDYQADYAKADEQNQTETIQKFIAKLGLPMEATDEMEPEHLSEIVQVLTGQKKVK
jgi:uncharacterized membrane protein